MKRKILCLLLALCMMAVMVVGCADQPVDQDSAVNQGEQANVSGDGDPEPITLTIWDWDAAHLEHMTQLYTSLNPHVTFETLIVQPVDYMQMLQSALAAGTGVPDIILGAIYYRGRLFELGILEDLSQPPYNVNRNEMFDFAVQFGTGPNGELFGIEQQICPSGFAFRRDLALEFFGTDDPAELSQLIYTWDDFIVAGRSVIEQSGGDVTIFPGVSVLIREVLIGQTPMEFVHGDVINLTDRFLPLLEQAVEISQANILGNQELATPALNSGVGAGDFIFFPIAPWSMKWEIEANDPEGSGNWGLMRAPGGGFTRGGTSISIYSGSPHKEAAWDYIQFTYTTGDGVREAFEQFGFMTGFTEPYEDPNSYFFTVPGAFDEFFGGQNLAYYFINVITVETPGQVQTRHESNVNNAILAVIGQMAADRSITAEQALELLKQEVAILIPEADIR